jgi:lytic murein transglycosylase
MRDSGWDGTCDLLKDTVSDEEREPRTPRDNSCAARHNRSMPAFLLLPALLLTIGAPAVLSAQPARRGGSAAEASAPSLAEFTRCLAGLRETAVKARVAPAIWREHTAALTPDVRVLANLDAQPEFRLAIWDYVAVMVDDERIVDGQTAMREHAPLLQALTQRYGVDATVLAAVWGVETNFGRGLGAYPIIQSLATLSCAGRRQAYFRSELFAALRILQAGHIAPEQLYGSWAGAFGHVQFMPSTFERLAIDHNGDGRRDLMRDVPDALASAANYLRNAGWQRGQPWGIEVTLPRAASGAPFTVRGEGRRVKRTLAEWQRRGVRRTDGSPLIAGPLRAEATAGLLTPAGAEGPAFLVLRNFDAIYRYNASESYALSIAHLADRLGGGVAFAAAWPTSDGGLSRAERREMQRLLAALGHDVGEADGVLGTRTIAAVRAEQQSREHEVTGRPGQRLLEALRTAVQQR